MNIKWPTYMAGCILVSFVLGAVGEFRGLSDATVPDSHWEVGLEITLGNDPLTVYGWRCQEEDSVGDTQR